MEVASSEDDLFFADLSKQISLLIMDDDDEVDRPAVPNCPSVSLQDFSRAIINPPARLAPAVVYEEGCRRESKGTGVFIPQLSQPRRKQYRQGRFASNYNTISHRQLPDGTRMVSRVSSNVVYSFKPKKV